MLSDSERIELIDDDDKMMIRRRNADVNHGECFFLGCPLFFRIIKPVYNDIPFPSTF